MARRLLSTNIDDKIIAEAINQSYKEGLDGISTIGIAKKLKISEPVIFAHFGTKKALIVAAFKKAWQPFECILGLTTFLNREGIQRNQEAGAYAQIQSLLRYKKEAAFLYQFLANNYFKDTDIIYETFASRRNALKDWILTNYNPAPDCPVGMIIGEYFCNFVSYLSHLSRGDFSNDPEAVAASVNYLVLGLEGAIRPLR